ncbi:hypothetical protein C9374_013929 [Naegleria lovaniensis]|uniref:Uncharacterized protein n=1 Tax=Naegleria lovaniensis TaxID=51637 RepID=A0AA88H0M5_NAELO|nr:uncharacterized protein C9374_013929 [Naegleria lovaniensis]KAG2389369.1 hypothetical protein C9374_013929 [Naegleria lovaniensis]
MSNYQTTSATPFKQEQPTTEQNPNMTSPPPTSATPYVQPPQSQPIYYSNNMGVPQQQPMYQGQQPFYNAQPVIYTQPSTVPTSHYNNNTTTVTSASTTLLGTPLELEDEKNAKLYLIIGLFLGIMWLICFVRYRRSSSARARSYANVSGALFFLQFFLSIAFAVSLSIAITV